MSQAKTIRVVIVDDMQEIREYLQDIITESAENIQVAAAASSGREAVEVVLREKPDVVLMDIQMETRTAGIQAIGAIHAAAPEIRCIVLTIHENDEYLFQAYQAGASDFITKTMEPEAIVSAIRDVYENELLLRPQVAKKFIREYQHLQANQSKVQEALQVMMLLSAAEYKILKLINDGYSYRDIARQRVVEESTIRSQANHILKKFNKKHMRDVVALLRDLNILNNV